MTLTSRASADRRCARRPNVSAVVRATSQHADGPYSTNYSMILPRRSPDFFDGDATQNPVVLSLRDGSLALYYVGCSCAGPSRGGPYSWKDCQVRKTPSWPRSWANFSPF